MTNVTSPSLPDIQAYGSWVSPERVRAAAYNDGLEVAKKVSAGEDGDCHPIWRTIKENFANKKNCQWQRPPHKTITEKSLMFQVVLKCSYHKIPTIYFEAPVISLIFYLLL